jgi:rod shape-determining protein MreD
MDIRIRKTIFIVINILLLVLQTTVFSRMKIGCINVNLAFLSIVFTSLFTNKSLFIVNGIVIGLLYDIFAYNETGYFVFLYVGIAVLIKLFAKISNRYGFINAMVTIFVSTFLFELISYWIHFVFKGVEYNSFVLTKIIMPQALVNTISGIFLFVFYLWLVKILRLRSKI